MSQTNAKNALTLEIDSLSYGPFGIGRVGGKAVMVPHTAPGDIVEAKIVESKDRYAVGAMHRLIAPSPVRQTPLCPYVGSCGGCSWQHLRYDAQLKAKQQSVEDALRRIGKLDRFELRPIIPSANEYHYRRRIRLHVDSHRRLGFYHASSHRLVEIDLCLIAVNPVNEFIVALRNWVRQIRTGLEYLEIISGDRPEEMVIVAKSNGESFSNDEIVCRRLLEEKPRIRGLILTGRDGRRTWGETRISVFTEEDVCLRAEANVFTQINPEGNRKILSELLAAGNFAARDRVLELYCGAGNFTVSIAKRVREIVAVEGYRPSIPSGKHSAQMNGIGNIHWISGRV